MLIRRLWISDVIPRKNCNLDIKRASADTQNGHRLRLITVYTKAKIDLYPDIFTLASRARKTYRDIFLSRLQNEKTLFFNPYHDTKSVYLSTLERFDL